MHRLLALALLRALASHPHGRQAARRRRHGHAAKPHEPKLRSDLEARHAGDAWGRVRVRCRRRAMAASRRLARSATRARPPEGLEARGLHVLPGVIDTHVHFREPGNSTQGRPGNRQPRRVLGGVTSVFEMPNTNPPTTTRARRSNDKLPRAKGRMWCDHAFYVGATTRQRARHCRRLEAPARRRRRQDVHGLVDRHLLVPDDDAGVARCCAWPPPRRCSLGRRGSS